MIELTVPRPSKVQFQLMQFIELHDLGCWKLSCNSAFQPSKHVNAWIFQSLCSHHKGNHIDNPLGVLSTTQALNHDIQNLKTICDSQVLVVKLLSTIHMPQEDCKTLGTGQRPTVLHSDRERFAKRPSSANTGHCQYICIGVGTKW